MIARAGRRRPSWLLTYVSGSHVNKIAMRSFEVGLEVGRTQSVHVDTSLVALAFRLGFVSAKDPDALAAQLADLHQVLDDHDVPGAPGEPDNDRR